MSTTLQLLAFLAFVPVALVGLYAAGRLIDRVGIALQSYRNRH